MKKLTSLTLICLTLLLFTNCASSYRSVAPESTVYSNHKEVDGLKFSYQYGVLAAAGNRKYSNKEAKKNIQIVNVKITNETDRTINYSNDISLYKEENRIQLLSKAELEFRLKQKPAAHLFYLLLTTFFVKVDNNEPVRVGYFLGPGLALGNLLTASGANNKFFRELEEYDLINKNIEPGETVFGIIGIGFSGYNSYDEINISLNNQ